MGKLEIVHEVLQRPLKHLIDLEPPIEIHKDLCWRFSLPDAMKLKSIHDSDEQPTAS
ncbi:hypothetical protein RSAG8_10538, partial [Rhizoctonia solani AG-8 WAC10335]